MAHIKRIPARENLNVSSSSPFVKSRNVASSLGLLPWKHPRLAQVSQTPHFQSGGSSSPVKFGSPGYPSPLDRLRLPDYLNSLDTNNSFTYLPQPKVSLQHASSCPNLKGSISGTSLDSFSFSPGHFKGSFGAEVSKGHWLFKNYIGGGCSRTIFPTSIINPNKGILILDSDGKVLTANKMALTLLGCSESALCKGDLRLIDFVESNKVQEHLENSLRETSNNSDSFRDSPTSALPDTDILDKGTVIFSGKVVDINTLQGDKLTISLWIKSLPKEKGLERWIAVMEPVERTTAEAFVNEKGTIIEFDDVFGTLFGLPKDNNCESIYELIPSARLDLLDDEGKKIDKQNCVGHTTDGATFPLCLSLSSPTDTQVHFKLEIWVFSNISGLVILDERGKIQDYNYNFTRLLLGYGRNDLCGMSITRVIPSFYEDIALIQKVSDLSLSSSENEEELRLSKENLHILSQVEKTDVGKGSSLTYSNTEISSINTQNIAFIASENKGEESSFGVICNNTMDSAVFPRRTSDSVLKDMTNSLNVCSLYDKSALDNDMVTSTPAHLRTYLGNSFHQCIEEGTFFGAAKHKDESLLSIVYQIRKLHFMSGIHYCIWILRDPEDPAEGLRSVGSLTMPSALNETVQLSYKNTDIAQEVNSSSSSDTSSDDSSTSTDGISEKEYSLNHIRDKDRIGSKPEEKEDLQCELVEGTYSDYYIILKQIGKGAFGCVQMSYRKKTGELCVTKFIRKSQVHEHCWVDDNEVGYRVPLEVSLLTSLIHPNIVVSALNYLKSLGIVHRDVKDENIILNENFFVKLIDFGSAAFVKPGQLFSLFAGTIEYCSPEVLRGEKYVGYEVDVWSLGITLYTLIYGENPFYNIDEIVAGNLIFPVKHSNELTDLFSLMLEVDPKKRITLESIAKHPWVNLDCNIEEYKFEEVVQCYSDEAKPVSYMEDLSISNYSLSTTSESFIVNYNARPQSFIDIHSSSSEKQTSHARSATSPSLVYSTSKHSGARHGLNFGESDLRPVSVSTEHSKSSRSTSTVDSRSFLDEESLSKHSRSNSDDLKSFDSDSSCSQCLSVGGVSSSASQSFTSCSTCSGKKLRKHTSTNEDEEEQTPTLPLEFSSDDLGDYDVISSPYIAKEKKKLRRRKADSDQKQAYSSDSDDNVLESDFDVPFSEFSQNIENYEV